MATLARMGAVCVDYDLYGWGESALQVGGKAHHTADAHTIQAMNGIWILDYMLANRKDIDPACIGVNGGSGGGTQTHRPVLRPDQQQPGERGWRTAESDFAGDAQKIEHLLVHLFLRIDDRVDHLNSLKPHHARKQDRDYSKR